MLQVKIAEEETKFGLDEKELEEMITKIGNGSGELKNVQVTGLMGMASFSDDMNLVRSEFRYLRSLFDKYIQPQTANCNLKTLSMGMSDDLDAAIAEGSTLVRIGTALFGQRPAKT